MDDYPGLELDQTDMAKQQFKEECDVNIIVDRHLEMGGVINVQEFSDEVVELPDNFDYHEALNRVRKAQEAFELLPAELREAHNHDPASVLRLIDSKEFQDGLVDEFGNSKSSPTPADAPADKTPHEEGGTVT